MPKVAYIDKNLGRSKLEKIELANQIIIEYQRQGFTLTLRQLYYQMVARGYIENNERSYKNFGKAIDDGRMIGQVDWSAIEDRTRNLRAVSHWETPSSIIDSAAYSYRRDKWAEQPWYVEVHVEKEALLSIVERIARELDIPYFACRGYVSQSEMWVAAERCKRKVSQGKMVKILHLGDHDPSGIDMTRDLIDRMGLFGAVISVDRLALNWDQVEQYKPPPNPAKLTDSRAASYIDRFGLESWELDALRPDVISDLIRQAVLEVRDNRLWRKAVNLETKERESLQRIAEQWDDVVDYLGENK